MKFTKVTMSVLILASAIVLTLTHAGVVFAQDASDSADTTTPAATASADIENLKARLATKVAQLRSVVKRAISGPLKTISLTSATIETKTKDIKIELTDDVSVAQIIKGKRTTLTAENLDEGDNVTVFGAYDETLELLKAQYIFIENGPPPDRVAGVVADVDEEDFVLTINTPEGRSVQVDVEKATTTNKWTKEDGIEKSGFSKIEVGDTVHVRGTTNVKDANRMSASRILSLGNITGAAATQVMTPTPSPTPSSTPIPVEK